MEIRIGASLNASECYPLNPGLPESTLIDPGLFLDHQQARAKVQVHEGGAITQVQKDLFQAIEKHGFVKGWPMTLDRLMRCGRDEVTRVPQVYVDGTWKYYDPLENNDFWWSKEEEEKGAQ